MENKRGAELTLNTVIIAALVVLVLVFVIVFFLGGFGGLTETFKNTFWKTTSGTDISLAVENCKSYCQRAQDLLELPRGENLVSSSSYCQQTFKVDKDGDGVADDTEYSCSQLGVPCSQEIIAICG